MSDEVILLVAIGEAAPSLAKQPAKMVIPDLVRGKAIVNEAAPDDGEPLTYAVTDGALPDDTILDPATGQLLGTPSTQGFYEFTVEITDSASNSHLAVFATEVGGGLHWVSRDLPNAQRDVPYSAQLVVTGGKPPYTFSQVSGDLPSGLTLTEAGLLSGTPDVILAAVRDVFTIRAVDDAENYTDCVFDVISWPDIFIVSYGLTGGTGYEDIDGLVGLPVVRKPELWYGGVPFSRLPPDIQAEAPSLLFSVSSGALPLGWSLDPPTGVISGTPLVGGAFTYTITVRNELGGTGDMEISSGIRYVTFVDQFMRQQFGDGSSTSFSFPNPFGTLPRSCVVYDLSSGPPFAVVEVDWSAGFDDTIELRTMTAPGIGQYLCILTG